MIRERCLETDLSVRIFIIVYYCSRCLPPVAVTKRARRDATFAVFSFLSPSRLYLANQQYRLRNKWLGCAVLGNIILLYGHRNMGSID